MMRRSQHPGVDACNEAVLGLVEALRNHQGSVLFPYGPIPIWKKEIRSEAKPTLLDYLADCYVSYDVRKHV
jgi:hypothetical protein